MRKREYTYKFRLYPNKEQETYLAKAFGHNRLLYNHFLYEKQTQCYGQDMDVNAAKNILICKSERNMDYNRGVVYKLNKILNPAYDCSYNRETIGSNMLASIK